MCYINTNRLQLIFPKAPPGVKRNLLRTYESWSPEYVSKGGNIVRSQALFALAWFHAVLQERRMYIPQVNSPLAFHIEIYIKLCDWFIF
jgi:hypothetical protein